METKFGTSAVKDEDLLDTTKAVDIKSVTRGGGRAGSIAACNADSFLHLQ